MANVHSPSHFPTRGLRHSIIQLYKDLFYYLHCINGVAFPYFYLVYSYKIPGENQSTRWKSTGNRGWLWISLRFAFASCSGRPYTNCYTILPKCIKSTLYLVFNAYQRLLLLCEAGTESLALLFIVGTFREQLSKKSEVCLLKALAKWFTALSYKPRALLLKN